MSRRQYRKFKTISIKLIKDEGCLVTDLILFQYNVKTDTMNVYDILSYQSKRVIYNKICESFAKMKRSTEVKIRMKELISNEPSISSQEIVDLTGYNSNLVTRYYMSLKKDKI